jgi:hypothetical protein
VPPVWPSTSVKLLFWAITTGLTVQPTLLPYSKVQEMTASVPASVQ